MREIKFRIWDLENKKWFTEWDTEFLPIWTKGGRLEEMAKSNIWKVRVTGPFKVQEYTGLKDINGKEIYEGDIVKVLNTNLAIHNSDGQNGIFQLEYYNGSFWAGGPNCLSQYILRNQSFEVIGNIFENPDLLNETFA